MVPSKFWRWGTGRIAATASWITNGSPAATFVQDFRLSDRWCFGDGCLFRLAALLLFGRGLRIGGCNARVRRNSPTRLGRGRTIHDGGFANANLNLRRA